MSAQRTVVIDFHGTVARFEHGWRGYDHAETPEPGALSLVRELLDAGYRVVVVSAGADCPAGVAGIRRWLAMWGFPPLEVTDRKVPAIAYIDDRAVVYRGDFGPAGRAEVLDEVARLAACRTHGNETDAHVRRPLPDEQVVL